MSAAETEGEQEDLKNFSSFYTRFEPPLLLEKKNAVRGICRERDTLTETVSPASPQQAHSSVSGSRKWAILGTFMYAAFWFGAAESTQAPFFPREAESKGATPTEYGLVFVTYQVSILLSTPIIGKFASTVRPKTLLLIGLCLGGTACCVFSTLKFVPAGNSYIPLCMIVRCFEGIGASAAYVTSFTAVSAMFPESFAVTFALIESAFGTGLCFGPVLGGVLYELEGFWLPFVVCGCAILIGGIFVTFFLPHTASVDLGTRPPLRNFLADAKVIACNLTIMAGPMMIGFNEPTLEPHLRKLNLTSLSLGLIFTITAVVYAISSTVFGMLIDKKVPTIIFIILGYLLAFCGVLLIGPFPFIPFKESVGSVSGSLVFLSLGWAGKTIGASTELSRSVERLGFSQNLAAQAMVSAIYIVFIFLGSGIGDALGGVLLDNVGYEHATVVMFIIEMFFFLCVIFLEILHLGRQRRGNAEEYLPLRQDAEQLKYT